MINRIVTKAIMMNNLSFRVLYFIFISTVFSEIESRCDTNQNRIGEYFLILSQTLPRHAGGGVANYSY